MKNNRIQHLERSKIEGASNRNSGTSQDASLLSSDASFISSDASLISSNPSMDSSALFFEQHPDVFDAVARTLPRNVSSSDRPDMNAGECSVKNQDGSKNEDTVEKLDENRFPMLKDKSITIGFSGGTDSTSAALFMKHFFGRVIALTMWLYDGQEADFPVIAGTAEKIGIPHEILDLRDAFRALVIESYEYAYARGITPNPCVVCNRTIKYGKLLEHIKTDYLALGHYAIKEYTYGEYRILRGKTYRRDQSYNLFNLDQEALSRILFPLGYIENKKQLQEWTLPLLGPRSESVGACFLKGKSVRQYLALIKSPTTVPGEIVNLQGKVVGHHDGVCGFTIGQKPTVPDTTRPGKYSRRRVGTVLSFDIPSARVVVGDDEAVYYKRLAVHPINILSPKRAQTLRTAPQTLSVRTSQWAEPMFGLAHIEGEILYFEANQALRAPARGQYAVFYDEDELVGGGEIVQIFKD